MRPEVLQKLFTSPIASAGGDLDGKLDELAPEVGCPLLMSRHEDSDSTLFGQVFEN